MSSLISSFIIEPVVRQARRFSGAPTPAVPAARLSHASQDEDTTAQTALTDSSDRPGSTTTTTTTAIEIAPHPNSDPSDDSAAAPASVSVPVPAAPSPQRPAIPGATSIVILEHGRLTTSPRATPASLREQPTDDYMSYNPSYGIAERFRPSIHMADQSPRDSASSAGGRSRANTGRSAQGESVNMAHMSESLPADDGMRVMRQKIVSIRDMEASSEEKALRMHILMTERYQASHAHLLRAQSPLSIVSSERPYTPMSASSVLDGNAQPSSPVSIYSLPDPTNPFNVTPKDLEPSFRPRHGAPADPDTIPEDDGHDAEEETPELGCEHYKRNVKVQCFDCRRWYPCRHCHDEVEDHRLNRRKTLNMLCMLCATPQPAAECCGNCGQQAAWYYCGICKLWDDDGSKRIYHCEECKYFPGALPALICTYLRKCNVCISIAFASTHRCIERATDCDCPICGDYLFTSSTSVVSIKCGHYMHRACYLRYMESDYKCPICKKSAVNMELQWRKLEDAIATQPMPPQFRDTRVVVHCNDCSGRSSVAYHWVGNKCGWCDSFNTNELQLLSGEQGLQSQPPPAQGQAEHQQQQRHEQQEQQQPRVENAPPVPSASPPATVLNPQPIRRLAAPAFPEVRRASGSYFLSGEEASASDRTRPASAASAMENIRENIRFPSPYGMLARMSRSLSPIRHYLEGQDVAMVDTDEEDGGEGRGLRDGEEGEEAGSEESGESDEDMDDEENEEEDEEMDDGDELDRIELLGHR
ncbi:hypothetical protein W97_01984 [Coniosporium apollinis CBS 100218]|uniref:Zf-CHY-domain-containing protein n=1 Tax=Coniosporium apollinis (strain CBS 100218) TaxID=1168221 RepID=R7YLR8_CONA1|nr:uncharacterized protein W97_01984 [Coniosporium apollinis CBS 100218]EON62759.1 hypothetical protein W97_01984 [Coniosporium apollinis CBS 100218]